MAKEPPGHRKMKSLLRKLVKVPKSELDAELSKDAKRKAKRKKK